jgi:hypothetical protein
MESTVAAITPRVVLIVLVIFGFLPSKCRRVANASAYAGSTASNRPWLWRNGHANSLFTQVLR